MVVVGELSAAPTVPPTAKSRNEQPLENIKNSTDREQVDRHFGCAKEAKWHGVPPCSIGPLLALMAQFMEPVASKQPPTCKRRHGTAAQSDPGGKEKNKETAAHGNPQPARRKKSRRTYEATGKQGKHTHTKQTKQSETKQRKKDKRKFATYQPQLPLWRTLDSFIAESALPLGPWVGYPACSQPTETCTSMLMR